MARGRCVERSDESGETLIELLITLMLMGLAVVAILAGIFTVAQVSDHNARTTNVGNSAQSFAEQLKQPVLLTGSSLPLFTYADCATTYPSFSGQLPDADYTASIKTIQYVDTLPDGTAGSAATWSSTCPTTGDKGLQRLTIEVEVTKGTSVSTETVTIIKRDAACDYTAAYQNRDQGPC